MTSVMYSYPGGIKFVNRDGVNLTVGEAGNPFPAVFAPRLLPCPNSSKASQQYRPES